MRFQKNILFSFLLGPLLPAMLWSQSKDKLVMYKPDHSFIQYTGRIDFSHPQLPRYWQPGVYFSFRFKGKSCEVLLHDEMLWGSNHNYIEVVVDGKAWRLQTKTKTDTLSLAPYLTGDGIHSVTITKNTEANIGYMELAGIRCREMMPPGPKPKRKMEFIGNSITCGASSDRSEVPCGKGKWHDQHNAYFSYGAITARTLGAQYHLSSVSGIGLMHSCCGMDIVMPQVYDKVSMRDNAIAWDFSAYQPDIVTVCLGQNDGMQDSAAFCKNYIDFLKKLRGYYPGATFILLSSPMADAQLKRFMEKVINAVQTERRKEGDAKIEQYIFKRQYVAGCDYHPSLEEHQLIATELINFINQTIPW